MSETKIIAMPVPRMLAADLVFYTSETGLFLNEKDLVLHAVRSLFLDTYNGMDGELEEWMSVYRDYEGYGKEIGRIEVEVPVELFDAIIAPYRGKVVLVDFWNTWCGPCRMALKAIEPAKEDELE